MNGILYGVSVGPGDPDLVTLGAARVMRECDIIAVPRSGAGELAAFAIARRAVPEIDVKPLIELDMPMTRDAQTLEKTRAAAVETLCELLAAGKRVAFLTLGDVSIYATYMYLHDRVKQKGFTAEMLAGVPSFCAAAALLGESLTEAHQPLHIIPASYAGADEGLSLGGTKVLMKTGKSLGKVKQKLREHGLYEQAKMVERCGMEGERVFRSLDDADDCASYFSIIIIKEGGVL